MKITTPGQCCTGARALALAAPLRPPTNSLLRHPTTTRLTGTADSPPPPHGASNMAFTMNAAPPVHCFYKHISHQRAQVLPILRRELSYLIRETSFSQARPEADASRTLTHPPLLSSRSSPNPRSDGILSNAVGDFLEKGGSPTSRASPAIPTGFHHASSAYLAHPGLSPYGFDADPGPRFGEKADGKGRPPGRDRCSAWAACRTRRCAGQTMMAGVRGYVGVAWVAAWQVRAAVRTMLTPMAHFRRVADKSHGPR